MKKRIERLMEVLGLNQRDFAAACGLPNSTISAMGSGLSASNLTKIVTTYKNLDARWLLTGEGDMWMKDIAALSADQSAEVTFLRSLVLTQQQTIAALVEKKGNASQSVQL